MMRSSASDGACAGASSSSSSSSMQCDSARSVALNVARPLLLPQAHSTQARRPAPSQARCEVAQRRATRSFLFFLFRRNTGLEIKHRVCHALHHTRASLSPRRLPSLHPQPCARYTRPAPLRCASARSMLKCEGGGTASSGGGSSA
eukprot:3457757-Rhodomonas_salina.4